MVSLYLYTLLNLTDFFGENHHRDEAGYVLVAIIFASVASNFIKFFAQVIWETRLLILKRWKKVKIDNQDGEGGKTNPKSDLVDGKFVIPVKSNKMDLPGVYMHGQVVSKYNVADVSERRKNSHLPSVDGDTSLYQGFQPNSTISTKGGNQNTMINRSYINSYLQDQLQTNRLGLHVSSHSYTNSSLLKPQHVKGGLSVIEDFYSNLGRGPAHHHQQQSFTHNLQPN